MAAYNDVTNIPAWKLAHQMNLRVELFLHCPEFRRHFICCEQLRDAARSAPRHIEEGHGRLKRRDFADSVRLAKSSEAVVLDHLIQAHAQRLITTDELIINRRLVKRAMRTASALIRYLESTAAATNEERHAKSRPGTNQAPQSRIPPAPSIGGGEDDDHRADTRDDRYHRIACGGARRQ